MTTKLTTMRAMVVAAPGGPEALVSADLPVPVPGAGQARVKVAFVGMNPLDAMARREHLAWLPVSWPFVPGTERSGVIDAVGDGVDPQLIGRRVLARIGFGGYAEYSIAQAASLIHLPDGMSLKLGAAYRGCSATAWYALHASARIQSGDTALVHSAAGAVGAMAMQIARDAGARVCGLAGGPAKVAFARDLLGDANGTVLDYLREDWDAEARAFAGAGGFDVILDGNGGPRADRNYTLVGMLGRVVYIGATAGVPAPPAPVPLLITRSFSVGGIDLRSVEAKLDNVADAIIQREVTSGRWRVPVTEVVPLAQVASLHARLEAREVMGRAVIEVGGEDVA